MEDLLTISEIAKEFKRDRTTVLRWIERGLFPNARLEESPLGHYWTVPASDLRNFDKPKAGRPKKENSKLKAA
jgi:hypothetical protein